MMVVVLNTVSKPIEYKKLGFRVRVGLGLEFRVMVKESVPICISRECTYLLDIYEMHICGHYTLVV